ncbi:amino acid aldolase [Paenibacillus selenitireducens]|uniref:Amino acid aldolase n=1 Tax=Paenibacillus selenitireducens TaxID=1324314 RepID=A0A1T2X884_9BACL|nr:alanine racemase [Paenibacillus selenitireducens]OPA76091.1 amino acid aldolase [Paenibacillus selenitireducens]
MTKTFLETPCVIIDAQQTQRNVNTMAATISSTDAKLRPHAKTHKLPSVAHQQLQAGASGITVAKISEAEVMAEGGIRDIFVAYPLVTASKIERAAALSKSIRLITAVDSLEGARLLAATATAQGVTLETRLEIDTGLRRTGAAMTNAVALAQQIHNLAGLHLTGIYTFRGALLDGRPTRDLEQAGREEGEMMVKLVEEMRAAGLNIADVSVGSTPTAVFAAQVKGVTEVRPGTYVYQDRMQAALGVCAIEDCAGSVLVTVVSRPSPDLVVIDGGSKTFATDVQPNSEPARLIGFGHVIGAPDAILERLSEEHGMLRVAPDCSWQVGDQLRIIPNHICSTVNLHNQVIWQDGDQYIAVPVLARGKLE